MYLNENGDRLARIAVRLADGTQLRKAAQSLMHETFDTNANATPRWKTGS